MDIPIEIGGNPLFLTEVNKDHSFEERLGMSKDFNVALNGDAAALNRLDEKFNLRTQSKQSEGPLKGLMQALEVNPDFDFGAFISKVDPSLEDQIILIKRDAHCFSEADNPMIWKEIEAAKTEHLINMTIFRQVMNTLAILWRSVRVQGQCGERQVLFGMHARPC